MNRRVKDARLLSDLEALCSNLDIELRYEKGDFEGGFCKIKNDRLIIINKTFSDQQKIRLLARELGTLDLESIFIVPALREIIDNHLVNVEDKTVSNF